MFWVLMVALTGTCSGYKACHWPSREDGLFTSEQACVSAAHDRYGYLTTFNEWTCEPAEQLKKDRP